MTAATTPSERWRLGYRPELDGLRGIAVLLVIAGHTEELGLQRGGTVGVTLFFVLSGFLITSLLVEERSRRGRVNLPAFYARRALRLLPAIAALLVVVMALDLLLGWGNPWDMVLPVALYFGNWIPALQGYYSDLHHTWSLSVEEQFYIIWPWLLLAGLALPRRVAGVLLAVAIVVPTGLRWLMLDDTGHRILWGTDTRGDALLIGCALALLMAARPWRPAAWLVGLAGAILVGTAYAVEGSALPFATFLVGGLLILPMAGAVAVAWASEAHPRALRWRPLAATGRISYGMYLWHAPLLFALESAGLDGVPLLLALLASTYAVAGLSWYLIETPFLRLKRRLSAHAIHPEPGREHRIREVVVTVEGQGRA